MTKINENLESALSRLESGWIKLLIVPISESLKINIKSLKFLQDKGYEGIYITLSKPAIELAEIFEKEGIILDNIQFVDGITQMYGTKKLEKNVEYVLGPLAIDAISTALYKAIPKMRSRNKFVFLDSITTVLLYNSLPRTVQFSHFLTTTLKQKKILGIIVSVARGLTNEKLIADLKKTSDQTISI